MPKKILICDEDDPTRESLKLILSDSLDLILVDSKEQCLEVLTQGTDIGLLLLGGALAVNDKSILPSARALRPGLPVLIIPGPGRKSAPGTPSAGEDGALTRPFKRDEVLAVIRKIMPPA